MDKFDTCMNKLKICLPEDFVDEQKAHYRDTYCDGGDLKSEIQQWKYN